LQTLDDFKKINQPITYQSIITKVSNNVSIHARNIDRNQTPNLDTDFFQGSLDAPLFSFETFQKNSPKNSNPKIKLKINLPQSR
jgi:hypothetical protein